MQVGITFDLRSDYLAKGYSEEETAEFDCIETIQAIEQCLQSLNFMTTRIGNIHQLAKCLVDEQRWDLVFNISEGMYGVGRESQVPALLDAYQIPYTFSDPLTFALCLNKAMAKRVVRDAGIPTTPFVVIEKEGDIETVNLPFPLYAKPLAEGTGKGVTAQSHIKTNEQLISVCQHLLYQFKQPVLVETYLSGREFTVGIIGTGNDAKIIGIMEILFTDQAEKFGYTFYNKAYVSDRVTQRIVNDEEAKRAGDIALAAWKVLNCRDGGRVDIRSDHQHNPFFMEANPLAGLHPLQSDLVYIANLNSISYQELITSIVESSLFRLSFKHQKYQKEVLVSV